MPAFLDRHIHLVLENDLNEARRLSGTPGAQGRYDAQWNDDFHHSARVALTGHNEAYYSDFLGTPQELVSAVKWGFLYQGQWHTHQKKYRGTPAYDLPPEAFLTYIQNHDQIAHSAAGLRMHALTSPGRHRAMTALTLLAPGTPMLFQGQEFSASAPFLYFADHNPDLARLVRKGRAEFLTQFPSAASAEVSPRRADETLPVTAAGGNEICRPDWRPSASKASPAVALECRRRRCGRATGPGRARSWPAWRRRSRSTRRAETALKERGMQASLAE